MIATLIFTVESSYRMLELWGMEQRWDGLSFVWIFDLVFFLVLSGITSIETGITVSSRTLAEARVKMFEERLALASTVQKLLLPTRLSGQEKSYGYRFMYEPAEQMSGDWINVWEEPDGSWRHLVLGDVVGKGPQAALAVAAIASFLASARQRGLGLEAGLAGLHEHLKNLFSDRIYTTLAAVSIESTGRAILYNAGALGWIGGEGHDLHFYPMRSSPIGIGSEARIARMETRVSPQTMLTSFTDGCLEGSRAVKRLLKTLTVMRQEGEAASSDQIMQTILDIGSEEVLPDDRTILLIIGEGTG
jgi:serine phosphatase RsbU (regulator of sigma subunit)